MSFSILISTYKNLEYLKLTINSIKKNSSFNHEIIVHNNGNDIETKKFLDNNSILNTHSDVNKGLCSAINNAYKLSTKDLIVYSHDDMYFLPKWDNVFLSEIKKLNHNFFYFSATQIGPQKKIKNEENNHIYFNAGDNIESFNEKKLLDNYQELNYFNLQGSHWAPHVVHKELWDKVKGFSEEFDPGFASDPDLNMKLWKQNVRIFKGLNNCRVYHFGSLTTRKRNLIDRNPGKKTFLLKWGITVEHFTKYYLQRGEEYLEPLRLNKSISYYASLLYSKLKLLMVYFLNKKLTNQR